MDERARAHAHIYERIPIEAKAMDMKPQSNGILSSFTIAADLTLSLFRSLQVCLLTTISALYNASDKLFLSFSSFIHTSAYMYIPFSLATQYYATLSQTYMYDYGYVCYV